MEIINENLLEPSRQKFLNFRHPCGGMEFLTCSYYQLQSAITILGFAFSSKWNAFVKLNMRHTLKNISGLSVQKNTMQY